MMDERIGGIGWRRGIVWGVAAAVVATGLLVRPVLAGGEARRRPGYGVWAAARTPYPKVVLPPNPFRPDDEHRVVSRRREAPPNLSPAALSGELVMLKTLFETDKIARDLYESETADVKAKLETAERTVDTSDPERERTRQYRRGAEDALRALLDQGAITRAVYEREVSRIRAHTDVDHIRGRLAALIRLYHRVQIDDDTFLEHYMPLWSAWYRVDNILKNGDFEEIEDRLAPERLVDLVGWREILWGHMDAGQSQVTIDRHVKHHGQQSLRFTAKRGPSSIELTAPYFAALRDDSFKIRFWVKAEGLKRGYYGRTAALHVFKSDGMALWLHIPEGTYDWTMMEARLNTFANVPEGKSEPCRIQFQFFGAGTLWLDDMVVIPTRRRDPRP